VVRSYEARKRKRAGSLRSGRPGLVMISIAKTPGQFCGCGAVKEYLFPLPFFFFWGIFILLARVRYIDKKLIFKSFHSSLLLQVTIITSIYEE
jgi:hypothetical protein